MTEVLDCPICGSPMTVVRSNEGTTHFEPLAQSVPRSVADSLAKALEHIQALNADNADPGYSESPDYWVGVRAAADLAEDALADYRAKYPKEPS